MFTFFTITYNTNNTYTTDTYYNTNIIYNTDNTESLRRLD